MRILSALVLTAAVLALPATAAFAFGCGSKCNQHMCPAAQASTSVGMEVVTQLSLITADATELES